MRRCFFLFCFFVIGLIETAGSKIVGYDHIGNSVEYELNVLGVRGAGQVAVDLLLLALVLRNELSLYILGCLVIFVLALILWKAFAQAGARYLLLEQVLFVQEENN